MTSWMRADCSGGASFIYKNLAADSSGITEIFLQYDIWICGSMFGSFEEGGWGSWGSVYDEYGAGGQTYPISEPNDIFLGDQVGLGSDAELTKLFTPSIGGDVTVLTPASFGLHTIVVHINLTDDVDDWTVDGDLTSAWPISPTQLDVLTIGPADAGPELPQAVYYVTNVKAGTTGVGSTDIIDDDFSGGDFSAWDGTSGSVAIVTIDEPCSVRSLRNLFIFTFNEMRMDTGT